MMQNIIHQNIMKYIVKNFVFLILYGFKMEMKISFLVLDIWLFGFGKVLLVFFKKF